MRLKLIAVLLTLFGISIPALPAMAVSEEVTMHPDMRIIDLSGRLLLAVKSETSIDSIVSLLAAMPMTDLVSGLSDDTARKVFWINMYNAWFQILSVRDHKSKPEIFTGKLITIAGVRFSLDDIEHGILRRYRWKYSLGYMPQVSPSHLIRQLAVSKIDYHIHFALNCGARSCPPIAYYEYGKLNEQLEVAASSFLLSESKVDDVTKKVVTSKILQWFKGDFGGSDGIRMILSHYLSRDLKGYKISYADYDWTGHLKNYAP